MKRTSLAVELVWVSTHWSLNLVGRFTATALAFAAPLAPYWWLTGAALAAVLLTDWVVFADADTGWIAVSMVAVADGATW